MSEGEWFVVWLAAGGLDMTFGEFLTRVRARAVVAGRPRPENEE